MKFQIEVDQSKIWSMQNSIGNSSQSSLCLCWLGWALGRLEKTDFRHFPIAYGARNRVSLLLILLGHHHSLQVDSLLSLSLAQGGNNTVMDQVQALYQCCGVRGAEGYDQWRDHLEVSISVF